MAETADDEFDMARIGYRGATALAEIAASERKSGLHSGCKQLFVRRLVLKAAASCHFRGRDCRRPQ
jgi:hypothetical protein